MKVRVARGKVLGQGSYGTVYLGLDEETGRVIAVKEISFGHELCGGERLEAAVKRLVREITLIRRCDHANIVRYHGAERDGTTARIFMEYVPGGSMTAVIHRFGSLSESLAAMYTRQVLLGLHYLHGEGIVHRDIKCDNILVDVSGEVKLADFGAARKLAEAEAEVAGTPWFMAPEVMRGEGAWFTSDVWSVGGTVIQMVKGEPPFASLTTPAVVYRVCVLKVVPEIPEDIAPSCREFLSLCLVSNACDRASVEVLLAHSFIASVASQPTPPPAPPPSITRMPSMRMRDPSMRMPSVRIPSSVVGPEDLDDDEENDDELESDAVPDVPGGTHAAACFHGTPTSDPRTGFLQRLGLARRAQCLTAFEARATLFLADNIESMLSPDPLS